ncbi:glycosyltransferase, partial [Candidatus Woesearchaeota archaeon]|nr:glycosyltransferase [Candidatus Woesearchaeota archaeon]
MGFKKCVISTEKGADTLDVEDNKNIFFADDTITFANRIIGLLKNPEITREVAEKGYGLVKNNYDWKLIVEKVEDIIENK